MSVTLKWPMKFKVYPEPAKDKFYNVLIFKTKRDMHVFKTEQRKVLAKNGYRLYRNNNRFEAEASWWDSLELVKGRWRKSKCVGQVIFHSKFFGAGVVAHEMCHAALYHVSAGRSKYSNKFELTKRDDERLATVCGEMCRQFWNRYFTKGGPRK